MENRKSLGIKKPLKINTTPLVTSRSNDLDMDENEEKEIKPKEDYSSFLIRFLGNNPKKISKNKTKISSTFYNNNYSKKKLIYNPYNTNYSPNKRVTFSIEKNRNNNTVNKKNSIKNNNIENLISYTNRNDNNKTKPINIPIKNINQFSSTQYNNEKQDIVKSNDIINVNANLNKDNNNISRNSNILTRTPLLNNLKKNQKIKMIRSVNNLNKMRLNALYGYDKFFIQSKKSLLRKKDLIGLENYQNNILKVSQRNLSKDHMFKLFTELQSIKKNADLVKPLPPINYPALIMHSFKEVEEGKKHLSKLSLDDKKFKDMDDYEKEMYKIKKSNVFKRVKIERNKRMYKIYEILPEHVVDVLYKNKNKIIK